MGWLTQKTFMTNETVQLYFQDRVLAKTLIPLIPNWIKPNHLTVLRFFLIPFVIYDMYFEAWPIAIPLFLFAGFTDVLDGSLARVRKQITLWGTIADPTADKLLIGSVACIFIVREVHHLLALGILFVEFLIVLSAYMRKRRGEYVSANGSGKVKMFLQVVGVTCLFLGKLYAAPWLFAAGTGLLVISLGFAVMSLVSYGL